MPLTKKGKEIARAMEKQYGKKKGKKVFYASANKGTISEVHGLGLFSKADIERGYKVEASASDLSKLDYENNSTKVPMASRISPKGKGKCE